MPRRSSHEPARKRRRIIRDEISDFDTQESGPSLAPTHFPFDDFVTIDDEVEDSDVVEEVDLRAIEDEEDLRKAQEEQKKQREAQKQRDRLQKEALAGQKPVQNEDGPATLVNFSCIICMDSVTNLTATHCGERNGEQGKGAKCPVCRKGVSRNMKSHSKALPQVIPLEIKVRKKSERAKGKERASGR
ncbi:MAG: hypothetical protein MMC23_002692 [Stictis urceolatum]|nr:hypothetical protein [Stictis urceolata]